MRTNLSAPLLLSSLVACANNATPASSLPQRSSEPSIIASTNNWPTAQSAQTISGNPLRPGLWEFTRTGGMAANSLGKHCVTMADLTDPRSHVNGYLKPEEKQQCETWSISWQGAHATYDGVCTIRGNTVAIKGSINASTEYYSDEQQQARDESGFAQAVKDIINGRRIGDC